MSAEDVVREAHRELRNAVPRKRRQFKTEWGPLALAFGEAMATWDSWRAAGTLPPIDERVKGLDAIFRQVWPFTREWKFVCTSCDDLGCIWNDCAGDPSCGRHHPHGPHTYVTPCWCPLGRKFRPKPKPSAEGFAAAGKSKPLTRVGR